MPTSNYFPESMKVLIVDDVTDNVNVLVSTLKPAGYKVAIAQSGKSALNIVKRFYPDLILLDVMMPEMDGFEVCKQLKKDAQTASIPVIFCTAKSDVESVVKGFNLGAVDYIDKPFRQEEVRARVDTHLKLRSAETNLKKSIELKNKFVGMVAHDIRSPLSAIIGYLEMFIEDYGIDDGEQSKLLSVILSASNDMIHIVENFLEMSLVANGHLKLQKAYCNIDDIIKKTIQLFELKASKKNITMNLNCQYSEQVYIDRFRMAQIMHNLINNALKYIPINSRVDIQVSGGVGLKISVSDNGPGISPEFKKSIFEDYGKLSDDSTLEEKSCGLGLAIVKQIIQAHGGTIAEIGKKGQGCCFVMELPIDRAAMVEHLQSETL